VKANPRASGGELQDQASDKPEVTSPGFCLAGFHALEVDDGKMPAFRIPPGEPGLRPLQLETSPAAGTD
jgi:hypothetical protein